MAKKFAAGSSPPEGKRRTREHVIADLSVTHVPYFIANAGFSSEATAKDYGYDLTVNTFDRDGLIEPLSILLQLKASESLNAHPDGESYWFALDVRDYHLWIRDPNPVFLILYEATSRRAYWLYFQRYAHDKGSRKPRPGAKTVRLKVPKDNRVRTSFFRHARNLKQRVLAKIMGANPHA